MDQKFFVRPFAQAGDKTAIPDGIQAGGTVSFEQGFGFDYERELGVDPLAKAVPRQEMNYVLNALTDNVGTWQRYAFPEWITAANNGGTAYAYARGTIVRYRATGGDPFAYYQSRVDNNTALPTVAASWAPLVFEIATNAQALAGTDNATFMSPLRVAQYVASLNLTIPDATETVKGKVELATTAEANTGTDTVRAVTPAGLTTFFNARFVYSSQAEAEAGAENTKVMTPLRVAQAIAALAPAAPPIATETNWGTVELATAAESIAGALTNRAVHPAGLVATIDNRVPAATTAAAGKVELATAAETTTGTDATRAVTPAGLKVELDKKLDADGPVITAASATQRASTTMGYLFTSATDLKRYQLYANISDAVDGGFLVRRWNGASYDAIATFGSSGLVVTGVTTSSGGFGPTSSRHLKKFYDEAFPYGLETFEKFAYHVGEYLPQFNADGRRRLFMVAEDFAEHMPEAELRDLVEIDGVRYSGIDHSSLIPAMAKALADASKRIRALEAVVSARGLTFNVSSEG